MKIVSFKEIEKSKEILKEINQIINFNSVSSTIISVDDGCFDFMLIDNGTVSIEYGNKYIIETSLNCFSHPFPPPLIFKFDRVGVFLSIKVQPWMNSYFFSNDSMSTVFICKYPDEIKDLVRDLNCTIGFKDKVSIITSYFESLDITFTNNQILAKEVCNTIYSNSGVVSVEELSILFRFDRHRLNLRFMEATKYNLKTFTKIVRINCLIKDKVREPQKKFYDLAYKYGYFDPAHFTSDFRKITGTTPTKFFREVPVFQHRHI